MKTAIVILNWNTREYLGRFLPGILHSVGCAPDGFPGGDTEVIVADNESTDGSPELMMDKFPGARLIALDKNYGFTGGYNRALALLEGFDYYLLMNSDIEVRDGWLEPLVEWMDTHPRCAACGPKLHSLQQRDRFEYAGAAGGLIDKYGYPFCRGRVMNRTEQDTGQYDDGPNDVLWVSGACLMVRASLWKGLDSRFFAHMEEIDLCWRLQLAGYAVTVVPSSTVWHLGGGTLPQNSPGKLRLNYRNNLLLLSNNLARTYALDMYRAGVAPEVAAANACKQADGLIFRRMLLDGLSAAVYALTFRWSYVKAVVTAHNEYRKLRTEPDASAVKDYLLQYGGIARVKGLYGKWMVPQALIYGKRIFSKICV